MKDSLFNQLSKFLQLHYSYEKPLLLGYSGGPDSKALLYLLLKCMKEHPFALHLAHVDHGWRKESAEEAKILEKEAFSLGLPFHLCTLSGAQKGNLEAVCRDLRLSFFGDLQKKLGAEALLLAHQRDDVAETVLKRILEGAHLPHLSGLKPVSFINGMKVLRPLLSIPKKDIYEFLRKNHLTYFEDETNHKDCFLRGRMRNKIIPFLKEAFGKEVEANLYQISLRSQELSDSLDAAALPSLSHVLRGPWGAYWEGGKRRLSPTELRHAVLKFLGFTPPRNEMEQILGWLQENSPDKTIETNEHLVFVDKGALFLIAGKSFGFDSPVKILGEGTYYSGNWKVTVEGVPTDEKFTGTDWKEIFIGRASTILPKGEYLLQLPEEGALFGKTQLRKWWSGCKIPAILRYQFPVLYKDGLVFWEFLTGKSKRSLQHSQEKYRITLEFKL